MRTRRYRTAGIGAVVLVGAFAALTACSNGQEGDRCQYDNGNDDCDTDNGLVCVPASPRTGSDGVVNPPFNNSDRCCPLDRTTATHPACTITSGTPSSDSGPSPNDSGPLPDVSVTDAADASDTSAPDAADAADGD